MVLACAEGLSNKQVAAQLRVTPGSDSLACPVRGAPTRRVGQRAAAGRPPSILPDQVEDVLVATQEQTRRTRRTGRGPSTAARSGLSPSTIGRIWRQFELKPHVQDSSSSPPTRSSWTRSSTWSGSTTTRPSGRRCCAWMRSPGYAAWSPHCTNTAVEFRKFWSPSTRPSRRSGRAPDLRQPRHHKAPAIRDWLARHPRFHLHFTPTGSSWINQVERWFGLLTEQLDPPRSPQERPRAGERRPADGHKLEPEPETVRLDKLPRTSSNHYRIYCEDLRCRTLVCRAGSLSRILLWFWDVSRGACRCRVRACCGRAEAADSLVAGWWVGAVGGAGEDCSGLCGAGCGV